MTLQEVPLKLTWAEIIVLLENIESKDNLNTPVDQSNGSDNSNNNGGYKIVDNFEDM